jgi:hypothetical protein
MSLTRELARLAVIMFAISAATPSSAQSAIITGVWNGSGVVTTSSGNTERVRCRAVFNQRGDAAFMNAVCATPSLRVIQSAELVRVSANRFTGSYLNQEYGVSGSIQITVSGNSLSASLSGGGGSGQLSMSR